MKNIPGVASLDDRIAQYEAAKYKKLLWNTLVEQAYHFCAPNRAVLANASTTTSSRAGIEGAKRLNDVWDVTAIESVSSFANNFQTTIMPDFQRWATIETAISPDNIPKSVLRKYPGINANTISSIKEQLEEITKTLFKYLEQSKFSQIVNQSLLDFAVGTAVLSVNKGNVSNPLVWESIPANSVIISESCNISGAGI